MVLRVEPLEAPTSGKLVAQLVSFQQRVQQLRVKAHHGLRPDWGLEQALDELSMAIDLVNSAIQQLNRHTERQLSERTELEQQSQYYYQLYTDAPAAYLITTLNGTLRQANAEAERLFCTPEKELIGRSITNFVAEGQRRVFRAKFADIAEQHGTLEWTSAFLVGAQRELAIHVAAKAARGPGGRAIGIRWILRTEAFISHVP